MTHEQLLSSLTELRLSGMKQDYVDLARIADRDGKTYEEYCKSSKLPVWNS